MGSSTVSYDLTPLTDAQIEEKASGLTAEERQVLLDHGTEHPFCGTLLDNKLAGVYHCRLCDLPLFSSNAKFDSGTGWPSFFQPFEKEHIRYIEDSSLGMARTEVRCVRCESHLGHVFPDGPPPTGQRYCLNSIAMDFQENS
ncbi:MAG: peptide-methionine (R)-S-oxide reductase MsrB [Marinobacter sp.]|uniref:peptide-methionine (R)-S-oxide reductase MsrB n=1 Tax=Marinobacter sp. TaxID=50741 RepID=UPI003F9EA1AF